MRVLLRWRVWLLALLLLVLLGQPVLAQSGTGGQVVFGQDFTLEEGQRLDGDLVVLGGNVTLRAGSSVRGDVAAFGGTVLVEGRVDGDVMALGGDVRLSRQAVVTGDVAASGQATIAPGAVVRGKVVPGFFRGVDLQFGWPSIDLGGLDQPLRGPGWPWGTDLWHWFLSTLQRIFSLMLLMALAVVVVLLAPAPTQRVGDTLMACPVQSVGLGLLTALASALALPILVIICIGIPVAVALVVVLVAAALFGWIAAAWTFGDRLLAAISRGERQPILAVALGILVLGILSAAPCLGALVGVLVGSLGLGAVVLTRFGTRPYLGAPPASTPAPPEPPEAPLPPLTA